MKARNLKCVSSMRGSETNARSVKWNAQSVEVLEFSVAHDDYNQRLDEWASAVYDYVCQLSQDQKKAPESLTVPLARESSVKRAA